MQGHVEVVEVLIAAGANTQLCAASCVAQKQVCVMPSMFLAWQSTTCMKYTQQLQC